MAGDAGRTGRWGRVPGVLQGRCGEGGGRCWPEKERRGRGEVGAHLRRRVPPLLHLVPREPFLLLGRWRSWHWPPSPPGPCLAGQAVEE